MRLGYFAMPVHPLHRNTTETLKEDRAAVILADALGYYDAFIGEHLTDRAENITNSMIFLATLIHATKTIKLATGTTNLSHSHPALVAAHAAMMDHLCEGRLIFGVSPGALASDAEALGILDEDRNDMFGQAIDVILQIWLGTPPYNIKTDRWTVTTEQTIFPEIGVGEIMKPLQKPWPEIVGTVVAPFSKGVIAMGERDFHPLSANFLLPKWVGSHWAGYAEGHAKAGRTADPATWRIARSIFVADDDKVAEDYGRADADSPYRFYFSQLLTKLKKLGRAAVFKTHKDQPDDEVTLDGILDELVMCGTVNAVVDQILAFREVTGAFGELVYPSMDWVDPALGKRSLELMATEVMPRVNEAIGERAAAAAAAAE